MAAGIVLFIGILQIGLIRPYYRNAKISSIKTVADDIADNLIHDGSQKAIDASLQEAVNNNVCVVIYNEASQQVYNADSLGAGCVFSAASSDERMQDPDALIASTANGDLSENVTNQVTGQEMIVYGKKIDAELGRYYLFVNSPLEPVDSIVSFFLNQYLLYTILAVIVASFVGFYIAGLLTSPIVHMKHEAQKLAHADYSASFDGGRFTETKELANTLNNADQKLRKIEEMRRDLMANVSHDIRTPLTNIRAYAEMIRDISGNNPEKREKHLNVIIREIEYMNRLVEDMSELSRMESGNEVLHLSNVDLSEKIWEIVEMDEPLIQAGRLEVHVDVPESLTVYGDATKLSQIAANYLSNAIKHTPQGKNIYVRAWLKDDEETVHFEVQDEGEGIPKEELPFIWDRYQKSSRSFSRSQTSTGLGLAIVKAIADQMHGTCGVESEIGKGSTFWFEVRETHEA